MTWFKTDAMILDNPKFIRAARTGGSEAIHLWFAIRCYVEQHLTDGFIEEDMVEEVRGPRDPEARRKALEALVTHRLLDEVEGGYAIHDFADWGRTSEDRQDSRASAREAARLRQQRSRSRRDTSRVTEEPVTALVTRDNAHAVTPDVTEVVTPVAVTVTRDKNEPVTPVTDVTLSREREEKSREDREGEREACARDTSRVSQLTPPELSPASDEPPRSVAVRKTPPHLRALEAVYENQAPERIDFTDAHRELAETLGLNLEREWEACRDYYRGKGFKTAAWPEQFATWLRKARRFQVARTRPRDERIARETEAAIARDRARRANDERSLDDWLGPPTSRTATGGGS